MHTIVIHGDHGTAAPRRLCQPLCALGSVSPAEINGVVDIGTIGGDQSAGASNCAVGGNPSVCDDTSQLRCGW
jgi:hypothetical protein